MTAPSALAARLRRAAAGATGAGGPDAGGPGVDATGAGGPDAGGPDPVPPPRPAPPPGGPHPLRRLVTPARVNAVVVAGMCLFVLWQLQPSKLFLNTLPSGGDMGAHVWQPAYLRDHLLPHGRLTGWAPDWYAGFPSLVFYFPLPSVLIVLLSVLLPYGVAFKLVTVSGLVTLPLAAYVFGRLSGMRDPLPACMSVAMLPYLFDRTYTIYGGNIASTLAGEFSFSISLSVALVFLGFFARGLENGRHRALSAVLLAVTALCHVVPAFFALAGALLLLAFRGDRHRLRWSVPVLATAGGLAAFWVLPFMMRLPYTNDMGWEKIVDWQKTLFPASLRWLVLLALVGALLSLLQRRRAGVYLTVLTVASAFAFVNAPQGRLWNARLLPFWFLCLWLLAGVALGELGTLLGAAVGGARLTGVTRARAVPLLVLSGVFIWAAFGWIVLRDVAVVLVVLWAIAVLLRDTDGTGEGERTVLALTPVAVGLAALVLVAFPLRVLWGGHVDASGTYHWLGFESKDSSFVPGWVKWNYSGYQSRTKPRHDEYFALMSTMAGVGRSQGCGRAMWEYESELDGMGTPMAPMLLPYWTHGCIGSMEGLFFESSATTPFHFLNQSELSKRPSRPQRNLPYADLDVHAGIEHLRLLGVRYYMALSPEAVSAADREPGLRQVATTGPWTVHYTGGDQQRTWHVYEVSGSAEVAPLDRQPAVMTGVSKGGQGWLKAAVSWYGDPSRWDVPLAVAGPKEWRRVQGATTTPPRVAVTPATVTNVRTGDDRISFDVDRVGSPVLVKASYFPNWRASGAKGPFRVTPNQMVVIPTSRHVSLHYGNTPVDAVAWLLTLVGLAGVVLLWRRGPVPYPEPPPAELDSVFGDASRNGGRQNGGRQNGAGQMGAGGNGAGQDGAGHEVVPSYSELERVLAGAFNGGPEGVPAGPGHDREPTSEAPGAPDVASYFDDP